MGAMFLLAPALTVMGGSFQGEPAPTIIPAPVSVKWTHDEPFRFSSLTRLESDCQASRQLTGMLDRAAGISLKSSGKGNRVVFRQMRDTGKMRPDWYTLKITTTAITVDYTSEGGAFYAVQTLRQLLPTQIESAKKVSDVHWTVPTGEITDGPRFGWRGMLLDCSRHFFPVDFIKKTIDRLAMMKMNVLHWHLVDDGGWRMEVKKYPNLTRMGAWRVDTGEVWPGGVWNFGNLQFCGPNGAKKYGGYYSQEQIKDIVKYAADRHVTVVPEIELPGHSLAAVVSYPELLCKNVPPADKPGKSVSNVYCAGSDVAIKFLEDVLTETVALFPSKFIHIGADEVAKEHWKNCPLCQARMKKEGLKDEHELQSWVVRHFDNFLAKKGRRMVGWDEILEGGLAEGATVMSWRGTEGGIQAAKQGKDVVMCPTSHCYFDYSYQAISSEHVYAYDPVPKELQGGQEGRVLGGQYNVWTEHIATEARCEELQFPRALAMAEVLWSPKQGRDYAEFNSRVQNFIGRLEAMGINYHLPSPVVQYTSVFFDHSTIVKADAGPSSGLKLRYTTDGTVPTSKSPEYAGGVKVEKPTTVIFAYVNSMGQAGDVAKVDCKIYENLVRGNMEPGLAGTTYLLDGEPSKMPNLATAPVNSSFNATAIDESARPRPQKFAVSWGAYLKVPKAGAYTFRLESDDGSLLWLNNALVVDNDGPHGAVEKSGTAWLPAGVYLFRLQWFDQGGGNSLKVSMTAPGGEKGPIPSDWFFRASHNEN